MDFWVPLMMRAQLAPNGSKLDNRRSYWLELIGRLKPGVTMQQAGAGMTTIAYGLQQTYPDEERTNSRIVVVPETKGRFGDASSVVTMGAGLAMVVVGVVLLIACANVANLLLARSVTRRKEIGIRLALGASRIRLIRQLLTESLLLSFLGGGLGLVLAYWATDLMQGFIPVLPYTVAFSFGPDTRALIFTLAISMLTGIIFGLAPALQASNPDVVPVLKGDGVVRTRGLRRFTLTNLLVVAQVALSLVVLICGALFVRSFQHALAIDPGFNPDNTLALSMNPGLLGYTEAQATDFYRRIVPRVESLPGVQSATVASVLPLGDSSMSRGPAVAEGSEQIRDAETAEVLYNVVGPKHFETLQIPLLAGRDFNDRDRKDSPAVVIVNETLARRLWPGQDPVGKRLRIGPEGTPFVQVVGMAKDGRYRSLGESPKPYAYFPHSQHYESDMTLVVRSSGDPKAIVSAVRQQVQSLEPSLPLYGIKTLREHLTIVLWTPRMGADLSIAFGLVALLLAATGLYSIMSYAVSRRTREIGIRMALGARATTVLTMVAGQGMRLALLGVGIGLAVSLAATRVLSSLLYGVSANDPLTFLAAAGLLTLIALLATCLPARKAMKVDPMVALRSE
jgi:macrolide transport system ATP-binding/permease protein